MSPPESARRRAAKIAKAAHEGEGSAVTLTGARGDAVRPGRVACLARLAACAGLTVTLLGTLALPVTGQSGARPTIVVAPTITAEPAAQSALPIRVESGEPVARNSFVRLRGLPPMAALSEGHSIAPGAWAVALTALPNLKLTLPPGVTGRSEVVVTLVGVDGAVLVEAKTTLIVRAGAVSATAKTEPDAAPPASASMLRAAAPPLPTAAVPEPSRGGPAPAAAAPPMTPQDRERAERLMKQGDEEIAGGNVSAARLLYERAAEAGLAQAAMALAATFDAAELERLKVRGIKPDNAQAGAGMSVRASWARPRPSSG